MADVVAARRAAAPAPQATRIVLRPKAHGDSGFVVKREGEAFRVIGERPQRWVRQTDFSNEEAVRYLGERLARLGVEDELVKMGAVAGAEVIIGPADNAVVFDWEPTVPDDLDDDDVVEGESGISDALEDHEEIS